MLEFTIQRITDPPPEQLHEIGLCRSLALSQSDCYPPGISVGKPWLDSLDGRPGVTYWCVYSDKNQLIASARSSMHARFEDLPVPSTFAFAKDRICFPVMLLGRMAVRPDFRKIGVSAHINLSRIAHAETTEACSILCAPARRGYANWYFRNGFENLGIIVNQDFITSGHDVFAVNKKLKDA